MLVVLSYPDNPQWLNPSTMLHEVAVRPSDRLIGRQFGRELIQSRGKTDVDHAVRPRLVILIFITPRTFPNIPELFLPLNEF